MKYLVLSQNKYALISDEDYERVSAFKWHASAQGRQQDRYYACRFDYSNGRRVKVWLHRFILGLPTSLHGHDPMVVDHADGDGLNCMRTNLSIVPWSHNLAFVNGSLVRKRDTVEPCL